MLKKLSEFIQEFIADRASEVEMEVLLPDRRYQELNDGLNRVVDRIEQLLPAGTDSKLLFDLDDLMIARDALAYRIIYRQGLRDGMVIDRWQG